MVAPAQPARFADVADRRFAQGRKAGAGAQPAQVFGEAVEQRACRFGNSGVFDGLGRLGTVERPRKVELERLCLPDRFRPANKGNYGFRLVELQGTAAHE